MRCKLGANQKSAMMMSSRIKYLIKAQLFNEILLILPRDY